MSTFSNDIAEEEDGAGWGGLVPTKAEQRAEARREALERDAARYRWLRTEATRLGFNVQVSVTFNIGHDWIQHYDFDAFDVAVDAAMKTKSANA